MKVSCLNKIYFHSRLVSLFSSTFDNFTLAMKKKQQRLIAGCCGVSRTYLKYDDKEGISKYGQVSIKVIFMQDFLAVCRTCLREVACIQLVQYQKIHNL